MAFSPNGQRLVSASWDGTARVWTLQKETRPLDDLLLLAREFLFITGQSTVSKPVEILETRLASRLRYGSLSGLWYANRLIQLPFAIFGLAIGRAVAPYLTARASLSDPEAFKGDFHGFIAFASATTGLGGR